MSESTHFKMPHCWKSHVTAHIFFTDEFKPEGSESDDEETIDKDEEGIDEVLKKACAKLFLLPLSPKIYKIDQFIVCLFDLIFYFPSTIFVI